MTDEALTIGRLARAADVNIETIRYYQTRKLLPLPPRGQSAFRYYPVGLIERIKFIKRAQLLGFSLDEIQELLRLNDGTDRVSIRKIARGRLEQIEVKLQELSRMRTALNGLIEDCQHSTQGIPCPIIEALMQPPRPKSRRKAMIDSVPAYRV
jgi:MerR family mercuric resistance operon transcriptional regulator